MFYVYEEFSTFRLPMIHLLTSDLHTFVFQITLHLRLGFLQIKLYQKCHLIGFFE